jgi:hypothetical protein
MVNAPEIVLVDTIGPTVRNMIELAKPYNTIMLLYEDDFSDRILASWAESDRLNLNTKKLGEIYNGIEVHAFGLDEFDSGTTLELHIRESARNAAKQNALRTAYKSLLNELSLITIKQRQQGY